MAAENSDLAILDLIRKDEALGVAELARSLGVTATAVRQRLNRLMGQGLIDRTVVRTGRGRPGHRYMLTEEGRRKVGDNFADLALALWQEVRRLKDPAVRKGLLKRLAKTMADMYGDKVRGGILAERLQAVRRLFASRNVPFSVDESGRLPVLAAEACPYPELAEQDRAICDVERMMLAELLGRDVRLVECRLDGYGCCSFKMG